METAHLSQHFMNHMMTHGHGDPFTVLGMHFADEGGIFIRVCFPEAEHIDIVTPDGKKICTMNKIHDKGLFQADFPDKKKFFAYRLLIHFYNGFGMLTEDAYRFSPTLSDYDMYLINTGNHKNLYDVLGAHVITHEGVKGIRFAVWAPNAQRVSVVGRFNGWDGRRAMMRNRAGKGFWEIFIPHLKEGELYKYEIVNNKGQILPLKTDPVGFWTEMRPNSASIVYNPTRYQWNDKKWIQKRKKADALHEPLSIYEVHLGSWRRNSLEDNRWLTYREMAKELPEYLHYMGFTHVEFLPVSEHPFDGSWGYQTLGLYAPTSRYGTPDDFKFLVDTLHQEGFGVILDWVPAHFPKDAHGLAHFDGTELYEHPDPRRGEQEEWGTKVYNFGRTEVSNFLLANALYWIREFHIDGLRVDAVASMLYLDYGHAPGKWLPNIYGGRENLEAIAFLRKLNEWVYAEELGATISAEESTAWPMMSRPTYLGGLGFTYKWNMGWMNDTLRYIHRESVHRKYHQDELTFSFVYAFNENYILPLSHDEIVSGKGPILDKATGDMWQKFATVRAYYAFMFGHPGKQLLMMGDEFAQDHEWKYDGSLSWHELLDARHSGVQRMVKDLNELHKTQKPLYELDFEREGFEWIDGSDFEHSIVSFIRKAKDENDFIIVVSNFTPAVYHNYRIGTNIGGIYEEIFNSDNTIYGGSGILNSGELQTKEENSDGKKYTLELTIPPLATIMLRVRKKS